MNQTAVNPMRVLNACEACGRQYDVTHLESGRTVRCACGARFAVLVREPHAPRALRCSSCGGNLRDEARKCEYCAAEITLEERRLSSICPKCFARAASDAHFCMECGTRFDAQAHYALPEDTHCPRCKSELRARALGSIAVVECSSCAGFWMSPESFASLCEQTDEQSRATAALSSAPARQALEVQPARYLPCPFCRDFMARKNYGTSSGVIIDVCKAHGVWLDHSELEKILAFVRSGGLARARLRELEQLEVARRNLRAEQAAPQHLGGLELEDRRDYRANSAGDVFGALVELLGRALR